MSAMYRCWPSVFPAALLVFGAVLHLACGGPTPTPAKPSLPPTSAQPAQPAQSAQPTPPSGDDGAGDDGAAPSSSAGNDSPHPGGTIECKRTDPFGPIALSKEQYETARHGIAVRKLNELSTSKAQPVEVCGVVGQKDYLLATECADGSRPFGDGDAVRRARAGSVGSGGRCGTIIDLYKVSCPEATYDVYVDMYFCQEGENPW